MKVNENLFDHIIDGLNLSHYPSVYSGKVRDSISINGMRLLIATDRLSAFDRVLTTIPLKGAILTTLATYWLKETASISKNHLVEVPHPNISVCLECEVIPIEVVVRGYLTGSAWRAYQKGESVSGVILPRGMKEFERFSSPLLTPSTKAAIGSHDEPISEADIIAQGVVSQKIWDEIREKALALFNFASDRVAKNGLILVDTKFEFGIRNGEVLLVDEIFTLDSSRYWLNEFKDGRPIMLDKEPVRQWLLSQGFSGDGTPPEITNEYRLSLTKHYLNALQKISGIHLQDAAISSNAEVLGVVERVAQQLSS